MSETYSLTGLYPNTVYYVWLAAKSQRGEGAPTPPIQVLTKQYGKCTARYETVVYHLTATGVLPPSVSPVNHECVVEERNVR